MYGREKSAQQEQLTLGMSNKLHDHMFNRNNLRLSLKMMIFEGNLSFSPLPAISFHSLFTDSHPSSLTWTSNSSLPLVRSHGIRESGESGLPPAKSCKTFKEQLSISF